MKCFYFYYLLLLSFFSIAYTQKPIVITVLSYNNAAFYKKNLDSICFQNHTNYHIIYIDDCSTDGTGDLVQQYLDKHNLHKKVTLIRNKVNCGAMANHYKAVWMCDDDAIIVNCDGDDFLAHNNVLKRLNEIYQDPNVWLTYGQFQYLNAKTIGLCEPFSPKCIKQKGFRKHRWVFSHLRTFYAGLFKKIKLRDFIYDGGYFKMACDPAMMFPMLEMAGKHIKFIPEVLYIYNDQNPLSDGRQNANYQMHCSEIIREMERYEPIENNKKIPVDKPTISLLIFANEMKNLLKRFNEAYRHPVQFDNIYVVLEKALTKKARFLRKKYKNISFINENNITHTKSTLSKRKSLNDYILLINDSQSLNEELALEYAITALEQSQAFSFNFSVNHNTIQDSYKGFKKSPWTGNMPQGCYIYKFQNNKQWYLNHACNINLLRTKDCLAACTQRASSNHIKSAITNYVVRTGQDFLWY